MLHKSTVQNPLPESGLIRSAMNDKGRAVCETDFHPIHFKISFPLFNTTSQKSWISQSDYAKCLLQVTKQPEELSSSCYGKGWHGFSRRHGGTPGSQPHWRCTQPDSSTAPSTGRSVMAAATPLPRPWAGLSAALVAAGPGSWCPPSQRGREMPEQSPHRLPCGPVLTGHRQPAASQPEPTAGQGKVQGTKASPHRAGRQATG